MQIPEMPPAGHKIRLGARASQLPIDELIEFYVWSEDIDVGQGVSMLRVQRVFLIFLISLMYPIALWAQAIPAENQVIGASVVGITDALCKAGTTDKPLYYAVFVAIMDQPAWVTLHSPTATPSPTNGFLATPGTFISVERANFFRAIRQGGTDSRYYAVCIPR